MFGRHVTSAMILATAAASLLTTACSDDSGTSPNSAQVRFVNAQSGGTGSLAFTTNGSAGSAIGYQTASTCKAVTAGSTTLSFAASNGTGTTTTIPAQTFAAGGRYTVVATGSASTPTYLVLNDATTAAASGRAWLRVLNSVGVGLPFDTYVGAPGAALGTVAQASTAFNTSYDYINVPAGATEVNATVVGAQTVLGTSGSYTLVGSTPETVIFTPATGVAGYTSFAVPSC